MILYVEDEKDLRNIFKKYFSHYDYKFILAEDASIGYKKFLRDKDDIKIIISDYLMPGLTGIDLCKLIRKESDIPFILLTGFADINVDHILNTKTLYKPITLSELKKEIDLCLSQA